MIFPAKQNIIDLHDDIIETVGGGPGVLNETSLD